MMQELYPTKCGSVHSFGFLTPLLYLDGSPHGKDCVNCKYYTKLVNHLYYRRELSEIPVLPKNEEQLTGEDTECFILSIKRLLEEKTIITYVSLPVYEKLATLLLYRHVLPGQQKVQKTQILCKVISKLLISILPSEINVIDVYNSIGQYIDIILLNSYEITEVICHCESMPCLQLLIKLFFCEKLLKNDQFEEYIDFIHKNYEYLTSMSDKVEVDGKSTLCCTLSEHPNERRTLYYILLQLTHEVLSVDHSDIQPVIFLQLLQHLSEQYSDKDFFSVYKIFQKRCDLNKVSSIWTLVDNLKSISPTQSEKFDFNFSYVLKRLRQIPNFEVIGAFVNTLQFLSIMKAVKKKNMSLEKQVIYTVVLYLLHYKISKEQTGDKISVILGSLQQCSDGFCDEDFWKVFEDYIQKCDIIMISNKTEIMYIVVLYLFQSMISTEQIGNKTDVVLESIHKISSDFCDKNFWRAYRVYLHNCGVTKFSFACKLTDNLKSISSTQKEGFDLHLMSFLKKLLRNEPVEVVSVFGKGNTGTFLWMIEAVKNEKQTMYEVVIYLLKEMISIEQTDDKISVILGSLQKLSEDFHDKEFWKIFKSYLQKFYTTKFSNEKQTMYKVLLHLHQYMISTEETSVTMDFLFKSQLKQSNEELWEEFKRYLQKYDLNKLSFILKLTDPKSVSSTHSEEVDIYVKQIVKRLHHEIKNGQMSSYDTEDFESFISLTKLVKDMKSNEKRNLCEVLFQLLQSAIPTEETNMEISVIVRPLQKLSDTFFDEDFWDVYRRCLIGFDLQKMSSLSRFTCVFKEAHPERSNDFDLYLFYILEKLYYETNKPGIFVNTNLSNFIQMVEKVKKTKKAYKTLCPVTMKLLKSWISSKQFQDKMVVLPRDFSKDFLDAIQSNPLKHYKKKMSPLMRLIYTFQQQANKRRPQIGEMGKRSTLSTLLMLVILLIISTIGHKSAQLKQWLALKYEYDNAILYLLWCSGDIEINPGPPTKKDLLIHDSAKERKWIQDISSTLLKLYRENTHSQSKNLWTEKPEDWPPSRPFYDTKNKSKDENGDFITDEELFLCIIECCQKKSVCIPIPGRYEITAWKEKKTWLLFKLHTYRTETMTIKSAIENLMTISNDTCSLIQTLKDLKISLNVESGIILTKKQIDRRVKTQTEIVADITRAIATLLCKILKGKDPEKKCDGIWEESPEGWPDNIAFFNPYNRGKYKHKQKLSEKNPPILPKICSDKELTETFLKHRKAIIPPKYKELVDAYQKMVKSTNTKKHREVLCRIYEILNNVTKLDFALQYLHEEGLLRQEVHDLLQQWWTTQQVDKSEIEKYSKSKKYTHERPEVFIKVTQDSIKLSTKPCDQICQTKQTVEYTIPVVLNITSVNNQPSTSTSCHKSHDDQQNQTKHGSDQQFTPSQSGTICLNGSQTVVSSEQTLNQNSTHAQSDLKIDGKLLQSSEGTLDTQGVCLNKPDIWQNRPKSKSFNRCNGTQTKAGNYKAKKISSTVLLIKKNRVQKYSHCHYKSKDPRTDGEVCVQDSTSTDDLNLRQKVSTPKIDDVSHKLVTTTPTTDDVDHGLVTNSTTTDDGPETSSPTIDGSQLISKPKKRKSATDDTIQCDSKRPCLAKDKTTRESANDAILPCNSRKPCLELDNMDDVTIDIKSMDFLDINMADLLLTNDDQSKLKDSDDLCMDILESCKNLDSEQCKNTIVRNDNSELEMFLKEMINSELPEK